MSNCKAFTLDGKQVEVPDDLDITDPKIIKNFIKTKVESSDKNFIDLILDKKNSLNCKTLLDCASGHCASTRHFNKEFENITGIDLDEQELQVAKLFYNNVIKLDAQKILDHFGEKSFDVVIALDFIEHLFKNDGIKFIKDAEKVARKLVAFFLPIEIVSENLEDNSLMNHRSCWAGEEFKNMGYEVYHFGAPFHHILAIKEIKITDFEEYKNIQLGVTTLESKIPQHANGQNLFINKWFANFSRDLKIIDIACGDGVGIESLKNLGFKNITGIEWNENKVIIAQKYGFPVYCIDFHDLNLFKNNEFDIVYSSHSLEHAFDCDKVLLEFKRIAKRLILVLPYPDIIPINIFHHSRHTLKTDILDNGESLINFISSFGFKLSRKQFDKTREPEIWLEFEKNETL